MKISEMRELAFQLIYSIEMQKKEDLSEQINLYIQNFDITNRDIKRYIKRTAFSVYDNNEEVEAIIKECLDKNWIIERISKVDISILKLAIAEIKYREVPYKVAINEAVELAKKYGEEKSSKFVNGALATAVKKMNIIE